MFVLILATIAFKTVPTNCQRISASQDPVPVGGNVTLSSEAEVTTGAWMFKNEMIVLLFFGNHNISNKWSHRVAFNSTNSALTIRSLKVEDSGLYTLQAFNVFSASLTLSVQVPVSNVTLRANETNLVEFNDTAVLTCSVANGTSLSYTWLNGSSVITAGNGVQISDGGTTLTMAMVTHYDMGPFKCNVSNGISYEVSPPVHLNISYGPSNTTMTITPMTYIHRTGTNITLSCSADSKPPAMIRWMRNGVYLNHSGPNLQLERVTESETGVYKCVLHNAVTHRFSSASAMIRILDPITAIMVNRTGGPAILHDSFTLRCEVTGSVDSIQWWKNGHLIHADNTTVFGMANKTLTINPVQHSDNGSYQCQAFNYVSNMTSSPYMVEVNYGPETPAITGPNVAKTGDSVTFSCHSSSHPPSTYKWFFNHSLVANTSEYTTPSLTTDWSGMYKCMAYNNVTDKNSTAYTMLTVVDPITHVQVEAPVNPAIAGYVYNLTCNVTGPADHVYWMKNDELLHENMTIAFYMHNKTLAFKPLDPNDTGYYQCKAMNAVSNMTSSPHMLLVNYGPEKPIIQGPAYAETGHTAVFNCSAKSVPPSRYSWWFNGSELANTSVLTTEPLSFNMSGVYTCMAHNHVTGRNSTSSKMLTVIEAIQSVMIRNDTIPISSENFTLTCEVTGPYDMIYWIKNNLQLSTNSSVEQAHVNMSYLIENNTLHFTPLTLYSDGTYHCVATNKAGRHTSPPYTLLVNYGPLSVAIVGPDSATLATPVSMTCIAESRPDCDFHWFLNNHSSYLHTGSVYNFVAMKQHGGTFICEARNPVTNISMYQTKNFTVDHASTLHIPSQGVLMLTGVFAVSVSVLFS